MEKLTVISLSLRDSFEFLRSIQVFFREETKAILYQIGLPNS